VKALIFKKVFIRNRSALYYFMFSYICILIIPILVAGLIYACSINVIEGEINKANAAMLKQVQQMTDAQLSNVERLSVQIGQHQDLMPLFFSRSQFQAEERYATYEITKDFSAYLTSNDFINDFYVYLNNSNMIIKASVSCDANLYYEVYGREVGMTHEQWFAFLGANHSREYLPLSNSKNDVVYVQSFMISSPEKPTAVFVCTLKRTSLINAINNLRWVNNGIVYIIDKNNNILFSTQDFVLPESFHYNELVQPDGLFYETINRERVAVSFLQSEVADWKYVYILPEKVFMEKANAIRLLSFISFALCILFSLVMINLFSRKNYNPIGQLTQLLTGKGSTGLKKGHNEYQYIHERITKFIDEQEQLNIRLGQQMEVVRNNFLTRMVKGKLAEEVNFDEACKYYNLHFASEDFLIIGFYVDDYSNLFHEKNVELSKKSISLMNFTIKNVVEELVGQQHIGYMLEADEMLFCIVNVKNNNHAEIKTNILGISEKAKSFIENQVGIYFSIGISNIHHGAGEIHRAYQEAIEAIEYRLLIGKSCIIHYDDIKPAENYKNEYAFSASKEHQFMNCIKAGDYTNAKTIVNEIFKSDFTANGMSVQLAKCRMFGLVNTMLNAVNEISITCDEAFITQLNPVDRLLKCESVIQLHQQVTDILEQTNKYVGDRKKSRRETIKDDIIEFIRNNYSDMDLSVSLIADEFGISISYLSNVFKEQTGEGALDYIHMTRIEKGKQLLTESNITIKDIAIQLGYSNSNTFIKIFKKYQGITPGRFQQMKKEQ